MSTADLEGKIAQAAEESVAVAKALQEDLAAAEQGGASSNQDAQGPQGSASSTKGVASPSRTVASPKAQGDKALGSPAEAKAEGSSSKSPEATSPGFQASAQGPSASGEDAAAASDEAAGMVKQVSQALESVEGGNDGGAKSTLEDRMKILDEKIAQIDAEQEKLQALVLELEEKAQGDDGEPAECQHEMTPEIEKLQDDISALVSQIKNQMEANDVHHDLLSNKRNLLTEKIQEIFASLNTSAGELERQRIENETAIQNLLSDPARGETAMKFSRDYEELDSIKAQRCCFFGFIDVHPPQLFKFSH